MVLLQWLLHCCCAKSAPLSSIPLTSGWPMGRGIAPVLCATRLLVTGGGRKPRTCALGRSGVKSLPCERFDPLTPFPPTSGRTMIRGIPVLCTTQLVNGVVRRTAALGGKIPCERRNPSASFPVPSSGPLPVASSGPEGTAPLLLLLPQPQHQQSSTDRSSYHSAPHTTS